MKKQIGLILSLLLTSLTINSHAREQKLVQAKLYHIYDNGEVLPEKIANFKLYQGHMSELHSTKKNKLPGGYWNLELRLLENNKFKYTFWQSKGVEGGEFWKETGRKNIHEKTVDISIPRSFSINFPSDDKGGLIVLDVIPEIQSKQALKAAITPDNFGLIDFCFNQSAVIMDDSFYLGVFNGFGERLTIGIPGKSIVNLSLKPLRNWSPIGTFEDGKITIDFDDGHNLKLFNVGIGPSGFKKGGPFTIFGEFLPPNMSRSEAIKYTLKNQDKNLSETKRKIAESAVRTNPFVGMSRGTIGNDRSSSGREHIEKVIGSFFEGQECG